MPKSRMKLLVVAVVTAVALGAGYGVWEWGRDKNYWGTPDDVAALWDLPIVRTAEELPGGLVDRAQRPNGGVMSKPEPAYIEFSVFVDAAANASDPLKMMAEDQGWSIEENCAQSVEWCAQMRDHQGFQLFMTVSDASAQVVEGSGPIGHLKRVRIFYL